jgi:hypothetical protein
MEEILSIARTYQCDEIIITKDIQNVFYGQYVKDLFINNYMADKNTVFDIMNSLMIMMANESAFFRNSGIDTSYVIYSDTGRNFFNRALVPSWKEMRKKQLVENQEKNPFESTAQSYMHESFKKAIDTIGILLNKLPKTYFYNLNGMDSDFIPILHKYIHSDRNSLMVIVSTDKDYIFSVSQDQTNVRYMFMKKQLQHRTNIFKEIFKEHKFSDVQRQLIAWNYGVFHALIGDSADGMYPVIPRKSITFWLKKLQTKLSDDVSYFRQCVIDDTPFDELLETEYKGEWDSSVSTNPAKVWDLYKYHSIIVDFYLTTLLVLDHSLLKPEDLESSRKLKRQFYFEKQICDQNLELIKNTICKDDCITLQESSYILKQFNIDPDISYHIY